MNDRVSRLVLTFDGEAGTIDQVLNGIKSSVRSAVTDIERTSSKVQLFGDIEKRVQASATALDDARTKAASLAAELDKVAAAGGKATPELVKGAKDAAREVTAATNAYNKNVDALTKMQRTLTAAGVDTSNLARAQLKLAEAHKLAADAAAQQAAKELLGLKTLSDIQPQIQKLNAAYTTLRESGKLSVGEIAAAQQQLQARLKETNAQVTTLGSRFSQAFGPEASSFLTSFTARFISVAAAVGGVAAAFLAASAAAKEYRQSVAEIGTVTNLTKSQLDELGERVRGLAVSLGFDLHEGLKAVFELIRSGVPPENAIEVLAVSAEAAKASLTDLGTAAKVSALLLDGFGLEVGDLRSAFDALVQGSKDGGSTLKEFAANAGPLLNVARDLKLPFNDVVAVLTVMTDASNDAAGSASALTKILVKLGDPEVRGKLRDLGITSTNVLEVFKQLGERGIPLQQFIDLGIASTKTAAGVAALTNNAGKLAPELDKIANSAGAAAKATAELFDSPKARADRFNAALEETKVAFGDVFGSGSKLAVLGRELLVTFNDIAFGGRGVTLSFSGLERSTQALSAEASNAGDNFEKMGALLGRIGFDAKEAARLVAEANATLETSSVALLRDIQALQAASARDIADLNARAEAEIAALDRSTKAQADTAVKTIAIQTKLAADRLAIIQKNEADITAAVNLAAAAQDKSAAETAKIRIDALAPVLKQYQDHYNALVALAQSYQAKVAAIAQERDSFTDNIRRRNDAIAAQGQSALDQYAANLKEIDRLIEASAAAAAKNEGQRARQLTDEAIARSGQIKEVLGRDGEVIIGKYEAIATATNRTKKAEDSYLASLDLQDDAAKAGFDAASKGIDEVKPKLVALQATYDELKKSVAEGLSVKIQTDETSVAKALRTIDELTKPRVIPITFQAPTGAPEGPPQPGAGFARGGAVLPLLRAFARGGPVFRLPAWNKVPGAGNGDTVPAALPSGSFVLRKAASQHYGDGLLGRLAQRFASGGAVGLASGGTPGEKFKVLHELKVLAETEFQKILDRAAGLPHPSGVGSSFGGGQDVRDYVKRVLELIVASQDEDEIKTLLDRVLNYYQKFYPGIEDAKRFNVPLVLGAFSSGAEGATGDSSLFKELSRKLVNRLFASGGAVDTVPAWLTPGEWVINPPAVRMYGGGFMRALNEMRVPRGLLDNILNFAPPRPPAAFFAAGGPVGTAALAEPRGGANSGSSSVTHVHHTWNVSVGSDPQGFVRRYVIPVLDDVNRRSAKKR